MSDLRVRNRRHPNLNRLTVLGTCSALLAQALLAHAVPAAAAQPHWQPAPAQHVAKAHRATTTAAIPPSAKVDSVVPVRATRLAGGTGRLSGGVATIGGLPLQAAAGGAGGRATTWDVRVAAAGISEQLGMAGAVVQLSQSAAGPASLTIDYAQLAPEYSADWASRLRIVQLLGCGDLTSASARCTGGRPVASSNDTAHQRITIPVLPRQTTATGATATAVTLALTSAASGSTGDFSATSLSRSATWQAGDSSGNFSWSYPLITPPTQGGPAPQLGLSYSSGAVDGHTASTNNQPSWVGEGFDLTNNYVERRYQSCADDGNTASGDECWFSDNASLVLNGKAGELVYDATAKLWHLKDDDGSKIEKLTGASNGDSGTAGVDGVGEYWKVTSTDGTQYIFGVNRLPGWVTGNAVTNSVWTVPVFGNTAGEPCHATTFDAGYCQQAWRWNLDRVIDPNGNSVAYYYTKQQNGYGRDATATKKSIYDMGGYLTRIDYGMRSGAEYSAQAPQQVVFTVADRCVVSGTTCTSASANWSNWPDVPWDQYCSIASTVTSCSDLSPTFFITKMLSTVTTQVLVGTTYQKVDSWNLIHAFPNPNSGTAPKSNAALELSAIRRTGLDGGTAVVSDVTFVSTALPNRVNRVSDGLPPMNKFRINKITGDSGDVLSVTYSGTGQGNDPSAAQDCDPTAVDSIVAASNGTRCYPAWYAPYSTTKADWFRKYVVLSVIDDPRSANTAALTTSYQYRGAPGWAFDDDPMTPVKKRLWNQWRGYQTVRTISGDAAVDPGDDRAVTDMTYFRGLGTAIVDSQGGSSADPPELAGRSLETVGYAGLTTAGVLGRALTSTITSYQDVVTATSGTLTARFVLPETTTARTWLTSGSWRTARTTTTYNSYGLPTQLADAGDLADATDDECTTTTYTSPNASLWIVDAVARSQTVAADCGQTPVFPDDAVNDTLYNYDGLAYGAAPTKGDPTTTQSLHDYTGGSPHYVTTATTGYDANGRVLQVTDVLGRITKTAYTPASGGPITRTVTTNALNKTKTTDLAPGRGVAIDTIDENLKRTDFSYDPLGRLVSVWQPNHLKTTYPSTPNYLFSYQESSTAQNWTKTSVLNRDGSSYTTSYRLLDGMLRPRQIQGAAPGAFSLVEDTFYNSRGLIAKTYDGYVADGSPSGVLYPTTDNEVDAQTWNQYDGSNRKTAVINAPLGQELNRASTVYNGNSVDTIPPAGGAATRVLSNAHGRTTESRSYDSTSISGSYAATKYTYTPAGRLATVTDAGGSQWKYGYDVRGFAVDSWDPDKGHTTQSYDDAGRVTSSTDALNGVTVTAYDALDRTTSIRKDSATGPLLSSWVWDTLAFGQLTSSTSYANGAAYTTTISGYNDLYQPTGQTVSIPSVEGPLAGDYATKYAWFANGLLAAVDLPAVGNWLGERVTMTYNTLNEQVSLDSSIVGTIVSSATYTGQGELATLHADRGGQQALDHVYTYDAATRRLAEERVTQPYTSAVISDQNYSYNSGGDLVKQTETKSGDTQCYGYDIHKQLSNAWTPSSGDCAAAPSSAALGGPAPYWQSWSYAANSERLTQTTHGVGSAGSVVETYNYPAGTTAQPHAVTGISSTGAPAVSYGWNASGQLTARPGYTYGWDPLGHLATDTTTNGDITSYLYDAAGQRLIRHDAKGATLYLGDTELRWEAGSPAASRYYSFGGDTVAVRTGTSNVQWMLSDPHNTALVSVDANNTAAITRRYQNPFGADRGAAAAFPGDHGFVDGISDPEGTVHLGAREYLPALGQFVSVDPIIDFNDPAQLNPYVYAHNDPVNGADPSGLMLPSDGGSPGPSVGGGEWTGHDSQVSGGGYDKVSTTSQTTTTRNTVTVTTTVAITSSAGTTYTQISQTWQAPPPPRPKKKPLWKRAVHFIGDITGINDIINCVRNPSVGGCVMAAIAVVTTVMPAAKGAAIAFKAARAGMKVAKEAELVTAASRTEHAAMEACRVNSFDPSTRVLLASGAAVAIASVMVGDRVFAVDPDTGQPARPEPVTDLIIGTGNKHLVDITIADTSGHVSTVTATDEHPFWTADTHTWTPAAQLHPGQHLVTTTPTAGGGLAVSATVLTTHRRVHFQQVYNLTVADLHTFYIHTTTGANLLTHNCGEAAGLGDSLFDETVLVRGGTNTAERFANGSGVTVDAQGRLLGVSVNAGRTVEEASRGIRNGQVGRATVAEVRRAGGTVVRAPSPNNPSHCLIGGCTAETFSDLFTPTLKNPGK